MRVLSRGKEGRVRSRATERSFAIVVDQKKISKKKTRRRRKELKRERKKRKGEVESHLARAPRGGTGRKKILKRDKTDNRGGKLGEGSKGTWTITEGGRGGERFEGLGKPLISTTEGQT